MRVLTTLIAQIVCLVIASAAFADDERSDAGGRKTGSKHPAVASTPAPASAGTASPAKTSTSTPAAATAAPLSAAGEGRRAWLKYNCSGCHGDRAGGAMGPNVVGKDRGDVSEAVREGEDEGMPSYGNRLTATEIQNISIYLRSIGTANEPKFYDWWIAVPPK